MEQNKNDQNKQEQAKPIRTEREKGNESVKPKTKEEIVKEKRLYLFLTIFRNWCRPATAWQFSEMESW